MIMFIVETCPLIGGGGCIADSDIILYQPLIDSLGGMGHEDPAFEICLAKDIGQRPRVVQMKTATS